ncbi:MAG: hypothetical protein D3922_11020 [Candidatus Electrothrix sp. AR1]|nr:hypothetical protein [Candidatus Electrothrix sp. AR1]
MSYFVLNTKPHSAGLLYALFSLLLLIPTIGLVKTVQADELNDLKSKVENICQKAKHAKARKDAALKQFNEKRLGSDLMKLYYTSYKELASICVDSKTIYSILLSQSKSLSNTTSQPSSANNFLVPNNRTHNGGTEYKQAPTSTPSITKYSYSDRENEELRNTSGHSRNSNTNTEGSSQGNNASPQDTGPPSDINLLNIGSGGATQ